MMMLMPEAWVATRRSTCREEVRAFYEYHG